MRVREEPHWKGASTANLGKRMLVAMVVAMETSINFGPMDMVPDADHIKLDRGLNGNNNGNRHSFIQICSFPMKIC